MANAKVPPNGFVGTGQQTLATQLLTRQWMGSGLGNGSSGRRRRKKAKSAAAPRRRKKSAARRATKRAGAKFVKGSAAAKRHMARLRKMRK